jgi:hypothetical protein
MLVSTHPELQRRKRYLRETALKATEDSLSEPGSTIFAASFDFI